MHKREYKGCHNVLIC